MASVRENGDATGGPFYLVGAISPLNMARLYERYGDSLFCPDEAMREEIMACLKVPDSEAVN